MVVQVAVLEVVVCYEVESRRLDEREPTCDPESLFRSGGSHPN